MTDIELLNQHRSGDQVAFAELVRRHLGWVYGVARRVVRDSHLAEDVAQAVFVLLHRKAPRFPADSAMMSWMHKTARYAAANANRTERRRLARETEMAKRQPDQTDNEWEELAPMLDELVGRLSRSDREAILLRYYRDFTFPEIAAEIGTSEDAARKRVDRAVEKLRAMADQKGVPVSAASLAIGLAGNIRLMPPPGLTATSTIVATAHAGSAIPASTAAMVKGVIAMTGTAKLALAAAGVAAIALIAGTAVVTTTFIESSNRKVMVIAPVSTPAPTSIQQARSDLAAGGVLPRTPLPTKRSPFSDLRWAGSVPQVKVNGVWYELIAVEKLPAGNIVEFLRASTGDLWQVHFAEDLGLVMGVMRHPIGDTVTLEVKNLATGQPATLANVPLTVENVQSTHSQANAVTPFTGVIFDGDTIKVRVYSKWYRLVTLNGINADQFIQFTKRTYGNEDRDGQPLWQKRIAEDLVTVLTAMNHPPGLTADMELHDDQANKTVTMTGVAMTPENRSQVIEQRGIGVAH